MLISKNKLLIIELSQSVGDVIRKDLNHVVGTARKVCARNVLRAYGCPARFERAASKLEDATSLY